MRDSTERLLLELVELPEKERAEIALRLIETLDDGDEISDAELLDELNRRIAEGFEGSMTWDELSKFP